MVEYFREIWESLPPWGWSKIMILMGVIIVKDLNREESKNPFMYQGVLLSQHIESLHSHKKIKKFLELTQFLLTELESLYGSVTLSLHHSLNDLRDKTLGCFCKPRACHGDVLVRLLNEK